MSSHHPELLCIDDDEQTLVLRKLLLENYGFHVHTANGGREGLRAFQSWPVDAVVLDYNMPEMDGGEVAVQLKRLDPRVPVMILSALPWLPDDAPHCIDAFVTKGESTAALASKIADMIAKSAAQMAGAPVAKHPPAAVTAAHGWNIARGAVGP
jgi:CheY-like chemotaxis protein